MPPKKKPAKGKTAKEPNAPSTSKEGEEEQNPQESSSDDSDIEEEGGTRVAGVYVPPPPPAITAAAKDAPRLIITHIANENFKSYAGRQVLGPFHKSFTSIIGPNGSGKSNVIDSMLFVFGYRATKIRSKKISVLLHKSEKHQHVKSATVEVHFIQIIDKEGEDFEVVKNSEFYISRTAFQDSSSFYTINGKRSQFKDVAALLGRHGIDLKHNRFLILQGEVEQIAMMKPKGPNEHETGMLEYLEDIVGTARYKKPIEKLEKKLFTLTEETSEKSGRLKHAEAERDVLLEPMNEAKKYLKLQNEHILHLNKTHQKNISVQNVILKSLNEEKEKLDNEMSENVDKIKKTEERISEQEKLISSKQKEYGGLKNQKEKLKESFNVVEKRAAELKEEITQTNKKRKKAMEQKKQEEKKLEELEKIPAKNAKEIEELTVVKEKLTKNREKEEADVQEVLASLKEETHGLQEEKDGKNNVLIGLNKKREDARAKYELAKTELSVYLNNEKKEKEKLEKLKTTLDNNMSQLAQKQKILEELENKAPQLEQTLRAKEKELLDVKNEETRVMQELNQQRSQMEEKRHSLSASASRNRVINFLMGLKEKGEIPGIFGRLGDLGGIDAKYDCAVSTACGPLDYVVVDTATTAKQCVNALKRSNVGRGNFIALDQQNKFIPNCNQRFVGPENVPRLFDLIKVEDERVKPAFYFGLRDTLVAQDLAQARRVAYGATRYRVVTLTGEIIEIAGTMSGGGRDKRTGRMGRSATVKTDVASPGAMKRLEERVKQLQEKATNLHRRMNELEEEIRNLTREVRKCRTDLTSIQMEVKNLSQQEPSLRSQVSAQEALVSQTVSDPAVVRQKTELVETLKKAFDEAAVESGKIEKQVAELTSKINAITGGKMQAAQQKLDKVTKQLDKVTTEITKLTVAIKTSERNTKKSKDRIQALTIEINEAENSLTKAQEDNNKLDEEAIKVNGFIESVSEKILEIEKSTSGVKSEIAELNKKLSDFKKSSINYKEKASELNDKIAAASQVIKTRQQMQAALKLNSIPGEEVDLVLPVLTEEELSECALEELEYLSIVKGESLSHMKPDLKSIEEYQKKDEIVKQRISELDEVMQKKNEVRKGYEEVKKERFHDFYKAYMQINLKLKEMYQMITFGGDAELELIDSLDPFSEGIGFSVRPPKKSWKHITNLSGGEKTLSSLALVFALHYYKPSPLYVMDEIDAALDFKNVSIVGHYIKERTQNAQFIIISLRSNMFELADVLVGIYKTDNCTKSVTITPKLYAAKETDNSLHTNKDDQHANHVERQKKPSGQAESNGNAERKENQLNKDKGLSGNSFQNITVNSNFSPSNRSLTSNKITNGSSTETEKVNRNTHSHSESSKNEGVCDIRISNGPEKTEINKSQEVIQETSSSDIDVDEDENPTPPKKRKLK